jgi:hypothetical protein
MGDAVPISAGPISAGPIFACPGAEPERKKAP